MYCVKCGVKLSDTEKQCPLCGTAVFHPDIARNPGEEMYPSGKKPAVPATPIWPLIIFSAAFLLPILIVLMCDIQLNGELNWAGYVVGALVTSYVIVVLPRWFRDPNPVIFVPCGFAAVALYVFYINYAVDGNWFLTLALPIIGGICAIVTVQRFFKMHIKHRFRERRCHAHRHALPAYTQAKALQQQLFAVVQRLINSRLFHLIVC